MSWKNDEKPLDNIRISGAGHSLTSTRWLEITRQEHIEVGEPENGPGSFSSYIAISIPAGNGVGKSLNGKIDWLVACFIS